MPGILRRTCRLPGNYPATAWVFCRFLNFASDFAPDQLSDSGKLASFQNGAPNTLCFPWKFPETQSAGDPLFSFLFAGKACAGQPARHSRSGLGAGALTQHSVLRGSMNSERPPESASSTPTGPGGSEGLREGPGYFLFESRRPFEHELTFHVPVHRATDNMLAQQALPPPPAAEARRQRVARAAARAVARVVAVAHQTRFAPPPSTPDILG